MMTPDNGRRLRLALATVWLADAALQYQPFMFTKAFGQTLAASAQGNPPVILTPHVTTVAKVPSHCLYIACTPCTRQSRLKNRLYRQ
jgi:hypothetical protein